MRYLSSLDNVNVGDSLNVLSRRIFSKDVQNRIVLKCVDKVPSEQQTMKYVFEKEDGIKVTLCNCATYQQGCVIKFFSINDDDRDEYLFLVK